MRIRGPVMLTLLSVCAGIGAIAVPAAAAPTQPSTAYDQTMLETLAATLRISPLQAAQKLDHEKNLISSLENIRARGLRTDGAFFDDAGALVVNAADAGSAQALRSAGLTPRTAVRGEKALDALSARVGDVIGAAVTQVQSWGPELAADQVVVTVAPGADRALVRRLSALSGVTVRTGIANGNTTQADVIPGQIMDLDPGTNCSLGFPGTTSDGDNVLLTAGHCVEGNPDILNRDGVHIGRGVATEFPSADMGLMDIDDEDTGRGYVDTRKGTTVRITGSSKAPVGTTLCKAGNTTGWTCGKITAYNQTVRYSGESVATKGLAKSTVCTEGGDSGGAYIAGNTAQGMTSGGPDDGHDCGYNQGSNATGSYSYYQPVVDAAYNYGVTLTRS
ncbi:S1 family peptidase [Amycolatopsis regifaucium]|uniref:Peptidase S1 n=1 Tax=Amycolatopsis regifaucium TaxID=546365 RepID=A0A154MEP1_9PSEU|nr:peptidase S1 [Amycolatopsis regifaucium]OKA11342.1 peptidase S1 [Amycolatopsis regifaucium]SFH44193.1 Trypsin [Amycolatopsis regifaucium]